MRTSALCLFALAITVLALPGRAVAGPAKVDRGHSGVMFQAHHFGAGYTWGRFNDFSGQVDCSPDGSTLTSLHITVQASSVDSGIDKRDKHLRSPDFLHADAHPTITFKSTNVAAKSDGVFSVTGDLSLHGVTRSYTVDMTHTGSGKLPAMMGGNELTGWATAFEVSRKAHDMETDSIGDTVKLHVNLEVKH